MSQPAFSRRVLLSAAAAAGAAISLPFGAESKESTTMDKKDMEGIRHYEFGNVTVTSISDGTRAQDPGLSLASKERIEELVRQSCQTPDTLEHYVNVFHIKSGRRSVVIDTGYGIGKGLALTRLFSEVKPTTITDVLITHCHPDHISGLTHNGEAAFPKAKVWVPKTDYEFFTGESVPEETRKATAEFFAPYEEAGHLKRFSVTSPLNSIRDTPRGTRSSCSIRSRVRSYSPVTLLTWPRFSSRIPRFPLATTWTRSAPRPNVSISSRNSRNQRISSRAVISRSRESDA